MVDSPKHTPWWCSSSKLPTMSPWQNGLCVMPSDRVIRFAVSNAAPMCSSVGGQAARCGGRRMGNS